ELQPAVLERGEDDVSRNELGQAGGLHPLIGILLGNDIAAPIVDQDVGAGIEIRRRWRGHRGASQGDQRKGRDGEQGGSRRAGHPQKSSYRVWSAGADSTPAGAR